MRVCGGVGSGVCSSLFMVSACYGRGRLCFGRGRDRGCVLVYTRTYTQTTWVLDVSPGVGRTPGKPEGSRSTKAQYTCRPYRCTKYICLYICWVAGFDDLG